MNDARNENIRRAISLLCTAKDDLKKEFTVVATYKDLLLRGAVRALGQAIEFANLASK